VAPGLISRDHSAPVEPAAPGRPFEVISLVGGKWTTFRAFAEQVADTVLAKRGAARRVSTADLPIGGARDLPRDDAARAAWIAEVATASGASGERVGVLLARYGTTAREVAAAEGPDVEMVPGTADTSTAEIGWIARNERVRHLRDILFRRTQLAITGQLTREGAEAICSIAGEALGWDAARREAELEEALERLATQHGRRL
jgi:glycerol-3-phosphate dehydrogenase